MGGGNLGRVVWVLAALCGPIAGAAAATPDATENFGPYNATFLAGGVGLSEPLSPHSTVLGAGAAWSLTGWVRPALPQSGSVTLAGVGDPDGACNCLLLRDGHLELRIGAGRLQTDRSLQPAAWHAVAATYDGTTARLYLDGAQIGARPIATQALGPELWLAPVAPTGHFGGSVAGLQLHADALTAGAIARLAADRPSFDLIGFDHVGAGWPVQTREWPGMQQPQDAWTLPQSKTPASRPIAVPPPAPSPGGMSLTGADTWTLDAWRLIEAPRIAQGGAQLSSPEYDDTSWYPAVVPGTVLTTLIARGVYPDPDYGLNNLAIPEGLSRQDYWYRAAFRVPPSLAGRQLTLTFRGINYRAEAWLNGARLGEIRGAFIRGLFDVTGKIRPGRSNVLAVRVSPPPHPGIAQEESIAAGPGQNGGALALDGPTFIATEGWDWIPSIRDRDTGIWQPVELHASGLLRLLDPHVVTHLPLPRTDEADVSITVQVENRHAQAARATLEAHFQGVSARKAVTLAPGVSTVTLAPAEFPALRVSHPRLWWPNGYGAPSLYTLTLSVRDDSIRARPGAPRRTLSGASDPALSGPSGPALSGATDPALSDSMTLRFGIREITYELSLFDREGRLRRVEVDPTEGSALGERLVDVRHEAINMTPTGWAASLTPAGESSPAVRDLPDRSLSPYLVIRVNGVRIAARGGSWGMDDALKRVSRARLEPYFRLHREAHLDIIRNWLGQNTEESFYELADEYGLLVLNDFWESTQNYQLEAEDPQLFLANARDVILRYRNHPSIAVWFGRNEGVPQPILNEGLADLVASLDGTRYYTGSSNSVNLAGSGPYSYRPPQQYFTGLAPGFAVEVGTPSLSTLESLQAMVPPADRWPIDDTLAYHDWHFGGNGDIASFMSAMAARFGAPASLEDFERKAQMMNYVDYRALFEGFQAHLWTQNSGRLLWMTHPAWPSNTWQIYGSDYDTSAAYYGVKTACEPLHAQMNLPDFALAVVNISREARDGLTLASRVFSLDGRLLARRTDRIDAAANAVATLPPLPLAALLEREGEVLVALTLEDSRGARLSENIYWQGRDEASERRLDALPAQPVALTAHRVAGAIDGGPLAGPGLPATASPEGRADGGPSAASPEGVIAVELTDRGRIPALAAKLTVLDDAGHRVLPVYYSDNYVSLLPGEPRRIEIRCPAPASRCSRVTLRGWNVLPASADVSAAPRSAEPIR